MSRERKIRELREVIAVFTLAFAGMAAGTGLEGTLPPVISGWATGVLLGFSALFFGLRFRG